MIAIITGASSGLGEEFARQVDGKFDQIRLIARRRERLEALSKSLKSPCKTLPLDLTQGEDLEKLKNTLEIERPQVGLLINSAGLGVNDYFLETDLEMIGRTLDLNCRALTVVNYLILPYMGGGSLVINVASTSAFLPQPKFAAYAASKSYVLSFSRALNREVRERGIRVSALCPNPVATEFQKNSKDSPSKIKKIGREDKERLVARALKRCPKKDLVTTSRVSKVVLFFSKILPPAFIMRIEKKMKMY